MQWLIVAMGVLLMLIGAISVISGAPIIQIERGWAEVIAGSVAVSGGVVTFAIGILLYRLHVWQHAFMAGRNTLPASDAPLAVSSPTIIATRSAPVADDTAQVAHEPDLREQAEMAAEPTARPSLWKSIPSPFRAKVDPATAGAVTVAAAGLAEAADDDADSIGTEEPPRSLRSTIAPDADPSPDGEAEDQPRRLTFPRSERPQTADMGRRPSTLSRDWMSRPLLRSRLAESTAQEPPPLFAGPSADLDDDRAPALPSPRRSEASAADAQSAPSIATEPAAPEPALPDVSVVGRYQAGSSTYTMYSNGSIDVETLGGDTHHFTSMDELKAFIARQENVVS